MAKLFGKKLIIEINGFNDELKLFQPHLSDEYIEKKDRYLVERGLKKADGVIVVSQILKDYCHSLGLNKNKVFAITNGGSKFENDMLNNVSPQIKSIGIDLKRKYKKLLVWSGSIFLAHHNDLLVSLAEKISPDTGFLLIAKNSDTLEEKIRSLGKENVLYFSNISMEENLYLISISHIGIALYIDYSWSRIGFYGCSLKLMDYLANGLVGIINQERTNIEDIIDAYNCVVWKLYDIESIVTAINNFQPSQKVTIPKFRSWQNVANETHQIISGILK